MQVYDASDQVGPEKHRIEKLVEPVKRTDVELNAKKTESDPAYEEDESQDTQIEPAFDHACICVDSSILHGRSVYCDGESLRG